MSFSSHLHRKSNMILYVMIARSSAVPAIKLEQEVRMVLIDLRVMGDKATLAKARQELEDLYAGVPDESVNLSFKDFVNTQQNGVVERKKIPMEPIKEYELADSKSGSTLGKLPSLDFARGMQASRAHAYVVKEEYNDDLTPRGTSRRDRVTSRNTYETSWAYNDMSVMSGISRALYDSRAGRKRSAVPHSKICTICSTYIYFFRHRCLVCGRVYCRQCVGMGMGEMTEGRKCIECLGRRFGQRYIHKAGSVGCCMSYPSRVKQQELKWAEKGPRRTGERRYGTRTYMSRSRSPDIPRSPNRMHMSGSPTSFIMSGIQSPIHPHIPL